MIAGGKDQYLEPLPDRLLSDPLNYILADHLRQRVLCHLCDRLADAKTLDPGLAGEVADHIAGEMTIHIGDEEEDLFPLLRLRAKAEDDIEAILGQLAREHAGDEVMAEKVVAGLKRSVNKGAARISAKLADLLRAFAQHQRRHLALENAIVIPLAKVRLSAVDIVELAQRMAARRDIQLAESN